jgi:phosphatidate phosphatase APP1
VFIGSVSYKYFGKGEILKNRWGGVKKYLLTPTGGIGGVLEARVLHENYCNKNLFLGKNQNSGQHENQIYFRIQKIFPE